MEKLFHLIDIQRRAIEADSVQELSHIVLNETINLVDYKVALFWRMDETGVTLENVSGNSALDPKGHYANELKAFIRKQLKNASQSVDGRSFLRTFKSKQTPFTDAPYSDYLLSVFRTKKENIVGGFWLQSTAAFTEADLRILEELSVSYAHSMAILYLRGRKGIFSRALSSTKGRTVAIAAVLGILLFPVKLTVTAPAEIVARSPHVVTAPYDGVLENIPVDPGDLIEKDGVIARMESVNQDAQMKRSAQELQIAKARLSRIRRESLANPEKKVELRQIQSDIESLQVEFDYAKLVADRALVRTPQAGMAVFADAKALEGKFLRTGEVVMQIADPEDTEILIRVPVDGMAPISEDAEISFFLNIEPLKGYSANVLTVGYQASQDVDGLLTYKVRGKLMEGHDHIRIGSKGTAKIYGDWTILSYAMLRRPLTALRIFLGI